jgi:NADPH-dependent glutamate synthase beta subunit-like oxidoreductase/ferredoxin
MNKPVNIAWLEANFPCAAACPAGTEAGRYVAAIAEGRYQEAYEFARRPNPFASVCGRICAAPCETACRRGTIDRPIAIRALKRFVTERYGVESLTRMEQLDAVLGARKPLGPSVAIIGAGPAGLACAHDLALWGYRVAVFEREQVTGGMLRLGVPAYRLPHDLLQQEIHAIEALGVTIRYGQALGHDFRLGDLFESGYEAAFIAVGAHESRQLDIPGIEAEGVFQAIDLLRRINLGQHVELGRKVLVIGGGDVAFDVARTALREEEKPTEFASDVISALDVARSMRRFGVRQIEVICLERPHEMPASPEEIVEASREGVRIHQGWGPERVLLAGRRVSGLVAREVKTVFDAAGRFAPTFGEGRREFQADTLVAAIGQRSNLEIFDPSDGIERLPNGFLAVNRETLATTNPYVFAGGDSAFGPRIVIDAVGDGKRAALSIHRLLSGAQTTIPPHRVEVYPTQTYQCPPGFEQIARVPVPTQKVEQRVGNLPVELGYNEMEARREALRCLHCWVNTVFEGRGASECLLCNGCADICPEDCINLTPVGDLPEFLARSGAEEHEVNIAPVRGVNDQPTNAWVALIKDEGKCIRCGLCAKRCPVGVITMEGFFHVA